MVCPIIFLFSCPVMSRSGFSLINRSSVVPRVNPMPVRVCLISCIVSSCSKMTVILACVFEVSHDLGFLFESNL